MAPSNNCDAGWQDYVNLFANTTGKHNEYVAVPIFPAKGLVMGNVVTTSAQVARELAGIGTPEAIQEARAWILSERVKLQSLKVCP